MMNLLQELKGLSGENLTSAALRFLIIRSQDARETFKELVSERSSQGLIVMQSEFSCKLEVPMRSSQMESPDQQNESGRIDLLMHTDNMIIGVENKLDAVFQPGQPEKYRQELEQLANQASAITKKRYVLVILAPEYRTPDIKAKIDEIDKAEVRLHYIQLSWETLLTELGKRCGANLDRISATLIDQLRGYILDNRHAFWPDEMRENHLKGVFDPSGAQGKFVQQLKNILPSPVSGGSGKRWTGYSFKIQQPDPNMSEYGWLGFVKKGVLVESQYESELILVTTKSPSTLTTLPPCIARSKNNGDVVEQTELCMGHRI
jgi:PD-(D/E)XK nuclease superfamily